MPLLSIIVPVYNKGKYIVESIDSILSQSFRDFEIIFVNDGSTDNSRAICEQYKIKDKRIIIIDQCNKGVSEARNAGIELAVGQYIGFIDCDDTIDANMFQSLITNAQAYDADISGCGMSILYEKKIKKGSWSGQISLYDNEKGISACLLGKLERSANNKIYKAWIAKSIRFEGSIFEDVFYSFKACCMAIKTVYQDVPMYYYKVRDNSVSVSKFSARYMQAIQVSNKIVELMLHKNQTHQREAMIFDLATNIFILNLILVSSKKTFFEEYQLILSNLKSYSNFVSKSKSLNLKYRLAYKLFQFNEVLYTYAILGYSMVAGNELMKRKAS